MDARAWLIQTVPENVFNLTLTAATAGFLNTSKQSDEAKRHQTHKGHTHNEV